MNYGYTVLRAATARAIVAAGLNPSLSIHHVSSGDALRLADDLMEPFRPAIDIAVKDLEFGAECDLTPDLKSQLVATLQADFETQNGRTPLSHVLVRLAQSLSQIYLGSRKELEWPTTILPISAADTTEGAWDSDSP